MLISKGFKKAACDGNKHFVSLVQFLFVFLLLCREFFLWSIYVFHSRKWTKLSRNSTLVAGLNHPIREQRAKGGKREKFLVSDIYIYFSSAHAFGGQKKAFTMTNRVTVLSKDNFHNR